MLAVLSDTNALFGALTAGPSLPWKRLLGLSAAREIDLVLPEVVQWELANQLRERLADDLNVFRTQGEKLRRYGLTPPAFGEGDAQAAALVAEASEHLRAEILWHRGRIAQVPNVPAAELARRSLERRLPFDQKDRGMRDTLLWLTALEIAETGDTVILVTNDKRAFGDADLHSQLRDEVASRCGGASRVILAADLDCAVNIVLDRTSTIRRSAERVFADTDFLAHVMNELALASTDEVVPDHSLARQGWPRELLGVRVLAVEGFKSTVIEQVDQAPDSRLVVRFRVGVSAELDARHALGIEFNDLLDLTENGDILDLGVGLLDSLAHVNIRRDVDLVGVITISPEDAAVVDIRLEDVRLPRRMPPDNQLRLELTP